MIQNDKLIHSCRFAAVTGNLELVLAESGLQAASLPEQITMVLEAAVESIGAEKSNVELIRELSTGDREFLILHLARQFETTPRWFTHFCRQCGEKFQFTLDLNQLPVKEAGHGYPQRELRLSIGPALLRVPNGRDQEIIAHAPDESTSKRWLLARLLTTIDNETVEITSLTENDLQRIDDVLEDISVEIAREVETSCPECGTLNQCPVSPFAVLLDSVDSLFSDIHTLAMNYHWSESEILALPRQRRQYYLHMIDIGRGCYDANTHLAMEEGEPA